MPLYYWFLIGPLLLSIFAAMMSHILTLEDELKKLRPKPKPEPIYHSDLYKLDRVWNQLYEGQMSQDDKREQEEKERRKKMQEQWDEEERRRNDISNPLHPLNPLNPMSPLSPLNPLNW